VTSLRLDASQVIETDALILQRTPHSEADWIVSLFTDAVGKVSAFAPGARKSKKRYAGGLEPFHGVSVQMRPARHGDLLHILEASISRPRHNLVSSLTAMNAAGRGLFWVRRAFPPMLPDPRAWALIQTWLNLLDDSPPSDSACVDARLAEFGLQLLKILGWSPELRQCVRCGKQCPPGASAYLNLRLGGIVCRACGGTGSVVTATVRASVMALDNDDSQPLDSTVGHDALQIVEGTLESHAGIE
jgi:DNA repair protein RecO (recombination protein O)